MIWIENQDLGKIILSFTGLVFLYYTFWVIFLPFVDEEYKDRVSAFFPPLTLALTIPSAIGSSVFLLLLVRAYHLVRLDRSNK